MLWIRSEFIRIHMSQLVLKQCRDQGGVSTQSITYNFVSVESNETVHGGSRILRNLFEFWSGRRRQGCGCVWGQKAEIYSVKSFPSGCLAPSASVKWSQLGLIDRLHATKLAVQLVELVRREKGVPPIVGSKVWVHTQTCAWKILYCYLWINNNNNNNSLRNINIRLAHHKLDRPFHSQVQCWWWRNRHNSP